MISAILTLIGFIITIGVGCIVGELLSAMILQWHNRRKLKKLEAKPFPLIPHKCKWMAVKINYTPNSLDWAYPINTECGVCYSGEMKMPYTIQDTEGSTCYKELKYCPYCGQEIELTVVR